MTPKAGPLLELIEPLQSFLQSFTQELTEQQFIPAFRDELRRLVAAIDNLQQSEETLQQIARGVDRLREVFAPAGTRLLEGVKDLETVMRSNASDLRDRSGQVLNDLLATHDQLENALRNEAGILQEQTSASRDALTRTVADVEGRLQTLTATIESLCRKMEVEAAELGTVPRAIEAPVIQPQTIVQQVPVTVNLPEELHELLAKTEQTVQSELQRQRTELLIALKQTVSRDDERFLQLDRSMEQAMSAVGPRLQEELDSGLERLREQFQSMLLSMPRAPEVVRDVTSDKSSSAPQISVDAIAGSLAASEQRILHELAGLRKGQKGEQAAAEKAIKDLAQDYESSVKRQISQINESSQQLVESLAALRNFANELQRHERQSDEQLASIKATIDALTASKAEQDQRRAQEARETLETMRAQAQTLTQKTEDERQVLAQLAAAMGRAEQAATTATDRAHAESRMLREKIDSALKDLAERMQRDTASETERVQNTLRQLAQAWQGELAALREDITRVTGEASVSLADHLKQMQSQIADVQRSEQSGTRDLQTELGRVATSLNDKVGDLQTATESFTEEMETHVKAVANEVAKQRATQEQSLAVLKEAIRANYDDNAARLKDVIEGGYETFAKQISTIPQALDRYSHLVQSLYQGDQLALQAITSDTKNILSLSNEKFDVLVADSTAMKKVYPLLDRKLEKHSQEIEGVRKAQSKQDKELAELKKVQSDSREDLDKQAHTMREELRNLQRETTTQFEATHGELENINSELKSLQEEDLPAFRREFATLLSTKFDLMETSVRERQEVIRAEIGQRLDKERRTNNRTYLLLGLLGALSVAVQIALHFLNKLPLKP